jgi:hypothetical protein
MIEPPSPELAALIAAHRRVRRPPGVSAPAPAPPKGRSPVQQTLWAVVGAVLAAAALLIAGRLWPAPRTVDPAERPQPASAVFGDADRNPASETVPRPAPPAPRPAPTVEIAPEPEPPAPVPSSPAAAPTRPRGRPKPAPAPAPDPAQARGDEARLLREAELQLDRDPGEALALLRRHKEHFPDPVLVLERAALHVLALCKAGQTRAGTAERDAFLSRYPTSSYTARVRRACPQEKPASP